MIIKYSIYIIHVTVTKLIEINTKHRLLCPLQCVNQRNHSDGVRELSTVAVVTELTFI